MTAKKSTTISNESGDLRMEITPERVTLWGLTRREYILAALDCLDQAGITPSNLKDAYIKGRGKIPDILFELDEAPIL